MNGVTQEHELSDLDFLRFSSLIREKSGLEIPEIRRPDLEKAISDSMNVLSISDPGTLYFYFKKEKGSSSYLEDLIAHITVGETYFFRNKPHFDALENHILPEIITKQRASKHLRIWSAGCSTGEEAYTLAILLRRLIPDLSSYHIFILGTDINRESIKKAKQGVYRSWSFRNVPNRFIEQNFQKRDSSFIIKPVIKKMVTFEHHNLVDFCYPSNRTNIHAMDLILCRNVMIYFSEYTTQRVVERLHVSLNEGGWLIVAPAETSQTIFRQFLFRNYSEAICYQKPSFDLLSTFSFEPVHYVKNKHVQKAAKILPTVPKNKNLVEKNKNRQKSTQNDPILKTSQKKDYLVNPPDGIQTAITLFNSGFIQESLDKFIKLSEDYPDDFWSPYWLAKIYANKSEFDNATYWIEIVLEREPVFAPAYYVKGLILEGLGKLEQSLESIRRCLYIDPEFLLGHATMISLFRQLSQTKRALKVIQNLEKQIANQSLDDLVPEGDGMTISLLKEFISSQKELLKS